MRGCVVNPYPFLGAPQNPCWPRGFPITSIQNDANTPKQLVKHNVSSTVNFAVLQSLADFQPDVDAIFRLTHKTPFIFQKGTSVYPRCR